MWTSFFKKNRKASKGFTLIELLVSIGVFVVVMTISLGSVISVLSAGKKSKALTAIMTNLNFTMEIMSREIKFGKYYYCGIDTSNPHGTNTQDCTGSGVPAGAAVTFTTSDGVDTIYRLNNNQIEKSVDRGTTYIGITSSEIVIQDLKYYVFDSAPAPANTNQARVIIYIRGYAGSQADSRSNFILQTEVSQRGLDN